MSRPAPLISRKAALWIAAAAVLVWSLVALVIVPWIIRSAWAGTSLGFLNNVITGRDVYPASFYVGIWLDIAVWLTIGLAAAGGLLVLAWRYSALWLPAARKLVRSEPTIHWKGLLSLSLTAGALAGLAEAASLVARAVLAGNPREAPAVELLWMAPIAAAFAGLLAATVIGVVFRAQRGVSLRTVGFVYGTAVSVSLLGALFPRLQHTAILLLALGVASIGAPLLAKRRRSWLLDPRLAASVLALALAGGTLMTGLETVREQRALPAAGVATSGAGYNVLFLILDTVRAKSLSLYGYERDTTPELSRWLADGVAFDRAIAPTPWTLPSHASMFTGVEPDQLSTDFDRALDDEYPTLAEHLRDSGYATAAFVANLIFASRLSGLDRGFARYSDHPVDLAALMTSSRWTRRPLARIRTLLGQHEGLVRKSAEDVNAEFLDWLDGRPDRPFFAFVNYFDAHTPYETHEPFDTLFSDRSPRYWLMRAWQRTTQTPEEEQEYLDAYESAIAYLDHHVGLLLQELDQRGILDNTLLVVVSDHGESLGEHGILVHANSLYMPQLHVPLGIRLPGHVPAGLRIAEPVSLADLPVTVLDITGLDAAMPGRSLARFWDSPMRRDTERPRAPGVFSELTYNRFAHSSDPIQKGLMRSIVLGDWHYILNGDGSEELYDLSVDPGELTDRAQDADSAALSALVSSRRALTAHLDSTMTEISANPGR
jgi:arylsulfatase A-like enzyme